MKAQRRLSQLIVHLLTSVIVNCTLTTYSYSKVIYTDVKPDSIQTVGVNISGLNGYLLDLNNDGIADFEIRAYDIFSATDCYVDIIPMDTNNGVVLVSNYCSAALIKDDTISDKNNFYQNISALHDGYHTWPTKWGGVIDGFLGLKVNINGNIHFGWVRLDVVSNGCSFTVKDYAYEDMPNKLIIAGEGMTTFIFESIKEQFQISYHGGNLQIDYPEELFSTGVVHITNMLGQNQCSDILSVGQHEYQLPKMSRGIYLISMCFKEGRISKKIYIP